MTETLFKQGDLVRINGGPIVEIRSWPEDNTGPFNYVQQAPGGGEVWGQGWPGHKCDVQPAEDPELAKRLAEEKDDLQAKLDAAMEAIAARDALLAAQNAAPADTVVIDDGEPEAPKPGPVTK